MWGYNLMVKTSLEASAFFLWKIIKLIYYFWNIYLHLLSKVYFQSNHYLQETTWNVETNKYTQLKFIKGDKDFLSV